MDKQQTASLFEAAVMAARLDVERRCGLVGGSEVAVELHGGGYSGLVCTSEEALTITYVSPDQFYRVIDLAIKALSPSGILLFCRISDHQPGAFKDTFNPRLYGPYKLLEVDCERLSANSSG